MNILSPSKTQNSKLITPEGLGQSFKKKIITKKYLITCKFHSCFTFLKFTHLTDIRSMPIHRVAHGAGCTPNNRADSGQRQDWKGQQGPDREGLWSQGALVPPWNWQGSPARDTSQEMSAPPAHSAAQGSGGWKWCRGHRKEEGREAYSAVRDSENGPAGWGPEAQQHQEEFWDLIKYVLPGF